MEKRLKVSVVQLGELPSRVFHGPSGKELNGSASHEHLIRKIPVDQIKEYNSGRIIKNIKSASKRGVDLIIFPELALSSFFPYFYTEDNSLLDNFFEEGEFLQSKYNRLIADASRKCNIAVAYGYAEKLSQDERYNTYVLIDKDEEIFKYRKTHIPGFLKPVNNKHFQYELKYFKSSKLGYPVFDAQIGQAKAGKVKVGMLICHDRRYNAPYTMMGLKGVELIINGFNTPFSLTCEPDLDKYVYQFHYLPQQGQSISEGIYILSASRAGNVYGVKQIAGSCIISPTGDILKNTEELIEIVLEEDIDLNLSSLVKRQKYDNERANTNVLFKELKVYKDSNSAFKENIWQ